jgi:hypothetical protein
MVERLARLRPGVTICPGQLARDCGSTLAALRGDLLALAREKRIVLSQGGKPVQPEAFKGPFRVQLRRPSTGQLAQRMKIYPRRTRRHVRHVS